MGNAIAKGNTAKFRFARWCILLDVLDKSDMISLVIINRFSQKIIATRIVVTE